MSSRIAFLLLCLSWAAIYRPALGDPELRGEEVRRNLPAQGMLDTGDWIVPRIAGEVYANKPPLINWAVAGMFAVTGSDSETSARLVSALSMLALALAASRICPALTLGQPWERQVNWRLKPESLKLNETPLIGRNFLSLLESRFPAIRKVSFSEPRTQCRCFAENCRLILLLKSNVTRLQKLLLEGTLEARRLAT